MAPFIYPIPRHKARRTIARRRAKQNSAAVLSKYTVRSLERRANRYITITPFANAENIAKCNPQTQSPLFVTLPAELREKIFYLALTQEDSRKEFRIPSPNKRPPQGHERDALCLLLTCRLAWLEANHIPMATATLRFCGFFSSADFHSYFNSLTFHNLDWLTHVELAETPSHLLETLAYPNTAECFFLHQHFHPRILTFSLVHDKAEVDFSTHDFTWIRTMLNMRDSNYLDEFRLKLGVQDAAQDKVSLLDLTVARLVDFAGVPCVFKGGEVWRLVLDHDALEREDGDAINPVTQTLVWKPCLESLSRADEDVDMVDAVEEGGGEWDEERVQKVKGVGRRSVARKGPVVEQPVPPSRPEIVRAVVASRWEETSLLEFVAQPW